MFKVGICILIASFPGGSAHISRKSGTIEVSNHGSEGSADGGRLEKQFSRKSARALVDSVGSVTVINDGGNGDGGNGGGAQQLSPDCWANKGCLLKSQGQEVSEPGEKDCSNEGNSTGCKSRCKRTRGCNSFSLHRDGGCCLRNLSTSQELTGNTCVEYKEPDWKTWVKQCKACVLKVYYGSKTCEGGTYEEITVDEPSTLPECPGWVQVPPEETKNIVVRSFKLSEGCGFVKFGNGSTNFARNSATGCWSWVDIDKYTNDKEDIRYMQGMYIYVIHADRQNRCNPAKKRTMGLNMFSTESCQGYLGQITSQIEGREIERLAGHLRENTIVPRIWNPLHRNGPQPKSFTRYCKLGKNLQSWDDCDMQIELRFSERGDGDKIFSWEEGQACFTIPKNDHDKTFSLYGVDTNFKLPTFRARTWAPTPAPTAKACPGEPNCIGKGCGCDDSCTVTIYNSSTDCTEDILTKCSFPAGVNGWQFDEDCHKLLNDEYTKFHDNWMRGGYIESVKLSKECDDIKLEDDGDDNWRGQGRGRKPNEDKKTNFAGECWELPGTFRNDVKRLYVRSNVKH